MGRMANFYMALPKSVPGFYIKGYTEALSFFRGVRVIPSEDFLSSCPPEFRYHFEVVDHSTGTKISYPSYYVPIKVGNEHFGFVLKSPAFKLTTGESWWKGFKVVNLDALYDPRPFVILVEGIKDSYLFLKAGLPVVCMLTAGPSQDFLQECARLGKTVFFAGDNDEAGHRNFDPENSRNILQVSQKLGLTVHPAFPMVNKDWGAVFDGLSVDGVRAHMADFNRVYNEMRGKLG
jgi:hypothetical protein